MFSLPQPFPVDKQDQFRFNCFRTVEAAIQISVKHSVCGIASDVEREHMGMRRLGDALQNWELKKRRALDEGIACRIK